MDVKEQLQDLIDEADRLIFTSHSGSPEFTAWHRSVVDALRQIYGESSEEVKKFKKIRFNEPNGVQFCLPAERQTTIVNLCARGLSQAKLLLQQYIASWDKHPARRKHMTDSERLQQLIEETDELKRTFRTREDEPRFTEWRIRIKLFLDRMYGSDSSAVKEFKKSAFPQCFFELNDYVDAMCVAKGILRDLEEREPDSTGSLVQKKMRSNKQNNKVFIVHGHDGELKEALARLLEKQGIKPVILSEQANGGKTIIEKFEENSDVSAAICLFTADDEGKAKKDEKTRPRARQNVVFEAGYFAGRLGRDRLVILTESGVEIPSDMQGIVYTDKNSWKLETLNELKQMGFEIDFNKLFPC